MQSSNIVSVSVPGQPLDEARSERCARRRSWRLRCVQGAAESNTSWISCVAARVAPTSREGGGAILQPDPDDVGTADEVRRQVELSQVALRTGCEAIVCDASNGPHNRSIDLDLRKVVGGDENASRRRHTR